MRRLAVLVTLVSGCGRLQFDAHNDGSVAGDDATDGLGSDTVTDPCAGGDTVCRISCMAVDPDCASTCGDGTCVGNAGELCVNCAECNTRTAGVCGNGQCDPGEDSDICYADCGPTPWEWNTQEEAMLVAINNARAGTTCPGGGGNMTAPDVARFASLDAAAREFSWERAYQLFTSGESCNGRTGYERAAAGGGVMPYGFYLNVGDPTPQGAVAFFMSSMAGCNAFLNPTYTRVGLGVTYYNAQLVYVVFLD